MLELDISKKISATIIRFCCRIHNKSFKILNSNIHEVRSPLMASFKAVAASSAYRCSGLDVCPPLQENLNSPEEAFLNSTVEDSPSILSETQNQNV